MVNKMKYELGKRKLENYRVLVLDGDQDSQEIILEVLRWEAYDARGVASAEEAHKLFNTWVPHVVILDWASASKADFKILNDIRRRLSNVSCVYVSDDSSTEAIINALDSGADDYIIKPFVPLEILARIRTQLRIRDLNEQLLVANEKLKELVDIDDLTGLFNMRSLYQRLDFEIERGRRYGRQVCVVMMDMDRFKMVNDGHDHLFGSFVLSEVGKIIRATTRNVDIPARYGGDEFMMVLPETNHEGTLHFCERIRSSIEQRIFSNGEDSINLTCSVGFAIMDPAEEITSRELVRRADHALYQAKRTGRNRVCFHTGDKGSMIELPPEKERKKAG